MLTLTARSKVAELQNGPPGVMQTLISTGIFRDGDDPEVTIGELCWNFGFNPGILLNMLQSANVQEDVPPIDIAPFKAMSLLDLVEHIEDVHHVYLRANLPELVRLTSQVAAANPDNGRLAALKLEMQHMATELESHLAHEEEALFAMVRDLAIRTAVKPTRCGDAVGGPIACMETEHEAALQSLKKMREYTDGYAAPVGADDTWQQMLAAVARFDQDMIEHMYKENRVLFPRALDAQLGKSQ
ncbi:MAG: hemerythrin domain-containing protein [Gammaproteobacteria bacterium]